MCGADGPCRPYGIVPHIGPRGGGAPVVSVRSSCRTLVFGADAYGVVPLYISASASYMGAALGVTGAFEILLNCRDGSAHLFFAFGGGPGVSWSPVGGGALSGSINVGLGLNFVFDLATASAYAGWFVSLTAGGTTGVAGAYGTGFTTPRGALNALNPMVHGFGGESYGFGLGYVLGTPGLSAMLGFSYFWDLGPLHGFWTSRERAMYCRCSGGRPTMHRLARPTEEELNDFGARIVQTQREPMRQRMRFSLPESYVRAGIREQLDRAQWIERRLE